MCRPDVTEQNRRGHKYKEGNNAQGGIANFKSEISESPKVIEHVCVMLGEHDKQHRRGNQKQLMAALINEICAEADVRCSEMSNWRRHIFVCGLFVLGSHHP